MQGVHQVAQKEKTYNLSFSVKSALREIDLPSILAKLKFGSCFWAKTLKLANNNSR
jgi:hypothetical protein